jgi:MoxR-like ATPase
MEEGQVTIGDETHKLPSPFFVLATQNPLDEEGTYPLPEAELDRFLIKILVSYPSPEEEALVVRRCASGNLENAPVSPVCDEAVIKRLSAFAQSVHIDDKIINYIVALVSSSRPP